MIDVPEQEESEMDGEMEPEPKGPERLCIVTRLSKPKEDLIRFVLAPDNTLVPDLDNKLPGRGIYVTCSRILVAEAMAKKLFSKATRGQAQLPFDFLNRLEEQLAIRVKNALSLTRKAGQVLQGFDKVEAAVKSGEVAALIHAPNAGADGVKKLRDRDIPTFNHLPREWLNEVLGRENAVHVAVTHGPAAAFFILHARRFALFLE
jgi:predicted RNA-binding protein YlxR (DUF448 family)